MLWRFEIWNEKEGEMIGGGSDEKEGLE